MLSRIRVIFARNQAVDTKIKRPATFFSRRERELPASALRQFELPNDPFSGPVITYARLYCYSGYQVFLIDSFYLALLVMMTFAQVDTSSYRACKKLGISVSVSNSYTVVLHQD